MTYREYEISKLAVRVNTIVYQVCYGELDEISEKTIQKAKSEIERLKDGGCPAQQQMVSALENLLTAALKRANTPRIDTPDND